MESEQMVFVIDDQPLIQRNRNEELDSLDSLDSLDPQIESLLTMAHRYGRELGELMKLGQVDDQRAVRLIKDFADGLTTKVKLSSDHLFLIRDTTTSVATAYAA